MSYLTETATLEFDPSGGPGNGSTNSYDYNLPHTKTIDLIGEEFAPKSRNVVVESIGGANNAAPNNSVPTSLGPNVVLVNASNSGAVPLQIIQQAPTQVRKNYLTYKENNTFIVVENLK